jgi:hypothetical protein
MTQTLIARTKGVVTTAAVVVIVGYDSLPMHTVDEPEIKVNGDDIAYEVTECYNYFIQELKINLVTTVLKQGTAKMIQ